MVQNIKKSSNKKVATKKSAKAKTPVKRGVKTSKKAPASSTNRARALLSSLAARKRLIAKILGASAIVGATATGGYYAHKNQEELKTKAADLKTKAKDQAAKAQAKSKAMRTYIQNIFTRKPKGYGAN